MVYGVLLHRVANCILFSLTYAYNNADDEALLPNVMGRYVTESSPDK